MALVKLIEFAKEGSKSIAGLVLDFGFPREEKPAREWFNYLFNATFRTINDLIDEINQMRIELEFLKKNGTLPTDPDAGVVVPPVDPDAPVIPPGQNPVGTWIVKQITAPIPANGDYVDIGNVVYSVKNSSGKTVKDVVMTWKQLATDPITMPTTYTSPAKDTDSTGEVIFTFRAQYFVTNAPNAITTVTAPNNPLKSTIFVLASSTWGSGGGGNANQTE